VRTDAVRAVAGIVAWLLVAALALVATEYWDPLWGAFPVLVAVVAMWLVGERLLAVEGESR
jgi:hypothetical protein